MKQYCFSSSCSHPNFYISNSSKTLDGEAESHIDDRQIQENSIAERSSISDDGSMEREWEMVGEKFVQRTSSSPKNQTKYRQAANRGWLQHERQYISKINHYELSNSQNQNASNDQESVKNQEQDQNEHRSLKVERKRRAKIQAQKTVNSIKEKSLSGPTMLGHKELNGGGANVTNTSKKYDLVEKAKLVSRKNPVSEKASKVKKKLNGSLNSTSNLQLNKGGKNKSTTTNLRKPCIKKNGVDKFSIVNGQNKQKNLENSKVSTKSNEFVILGDDLYDYSDMTKMMRHTKNRREDEEASAQNSSQSLNEKLMTENQSQKLNGNHQSKKRPIKFSEMVTYERHQRSQETIKATEIFDTDRLKSKQQHCIERIQKYLQARLTQQQFENIKASVRNQIQSFSLDEKIRVYQYLIMDGELRSEMEYKEMQDQWKGISEVLELSMHRVEQKCTVLLEAYGSEKEAILKWKNSKLHQLETARTFLNEIVNEEQKSNARYKKKCKSQQKLYKKQSQSVISELEQRVCDQSKKSALDSQNEYLSSSSSEPQLFSSSASQSAENHKQTPLSILQQQLKIIMNEEYPFVLYPQLKSHLTSLRQTLIKSLNNEKFPTEAEQLSTVSEAETTERRKMEETMNYFTPNGVLWFFQKYFHFILNANDTNSCTDKQNQLIKPAQRIIESMSRYYGFDAQTKMQIFRLKLEQTSQDSSVSLQATHRLEALIRNRYEQTQETETILTKEGLIQFQQQIIVLSYYTNDLQKPDPEINEQLFQYMHYFNLAIVDGFNEEFDRYRPFYPSGQPLPLLEKPSNKGGYGYCFPINAQSLEYLIEKCKYTIYTNWITFFAGLIVESQSEKSGKTQIQCHEQKQPSDEIRRYNQQKESKMLKDDIVQKWTEYHVMQSVAIQSIYEDLYALIEEQMLGECGWELFRAKN